MTKSQCWYTSKNNSYDQRTNYGVKLEVKHFTRPLKQLTCHSQIVTIHRFSRIIPFQTIHIGIQNTGFTWFQIFIVGYFRRFPLAAYMRRIGAYIHTFLRRRAITEAIVWFCIQTTLWITARRNCGALMAIRRFCALRSSFEVLQFIIIFINIINRLWGIMCQLIVGSVSIALWSWYLWQWLFIFQY